MIRKLSFRLFFLSSLVLLLALPFSNAIFAQGLELRIDSDNNGTIDNSPRERELAKSPYAFGKFIPYSETDEEFVEFQVVVPKAKNANEKRTLKFTFESNEVSLWEETPDGKKKLLFMPDVKGTIQAETKTTPVDNCEETEAATDDSDTEEEDETPNQENSSWWGSISGYAKKTYESAINSIWNRNIDEVPHEEPVTEIIEELKSQTFEYSLPSNKTAFVFYLKAETKPCPADWENSKTFKRPTRSLTVDLILNGKTIASDSAKYMLVAQESIYVAIQKQPLLSEAIVARAVYNPNADLNQYGLERLPESELKKWGFTKQDLKDIQEDSSSGFRVQFYRNWIHDKYYVAFKGTDLDLSLLSDMSNNVLLCAGESSPYLWQSLRLGCILREKLPTEIRDKFVIVGHSLGGALASAACIVSGIRADTFNSLGLSYKALKNSMTDSQKRSPSCDICKEQLEKCFIAPDNPDLPNDRIFKNGTVPLFTFHTQHDILTLFADCVNAKLQTKDETPIDILPSALGEKLFDKEPNQQKNKIKWLCKFADVVDKMVNENLVKKEKKLINNLGTEILKHPILSFHYNDILKQWDYATQRHSLDAVIEEILIQSGMSEAYGKAGNRE